MFVDPLFSEELLQHIWQFGLFNQHQLSTIAGEPVTIIKAGTLNRDAGPDFTAARINIGGVEWAGNVELHYRTSDWRKHGHQRNPRYDNVILHVVFENDTPATGIPCLELQQRIPKMLLKRYQQLKVSAAFVPCAPLLHRVSEDAWESWNGKLMRERMERKTGIFMNWLEQNHFNWEEVCFRAMAQALGMPVNTAHFYNWHNPCLLYYWLASASIYKDWKPYYSARRACSQEVSKMPTRNSYRKNTAFSSTNTNWNLCHPMAGIGYACALPLFPPCASPVLPLYYTTPLISSPASWKQKTSQHWKNSLW